MLISNLFLFTVALVDKSVSLIANSPNANELMISSYFLIPLR